MPSHDDLIKLIKGFTEENRAILREVVERVENNAGNCNTEIVHNIVDYYRHLAAVNMGAKQLRDEGVDTREIEDENLHLLKRMDEARIQFVTCSCTKREVAEKAAEKLEDLARPGGPLTGKPEQKEELKEIAGELKGAVT